MHAHTFLYFCVHLHKHSVLKFRVTRRQLASGHAWFWYVVEVRERSSSLNCPAVAVGGVGLSEVGAAIIKDISQKAQTGLRRLTDQGNWLQHTGETEKKKVEITAFCGLLLRLLHTA